jgi:hypothetical protein
MMPSPRAVLVLAGFLDVAVLAGRLDCADLAISFPLRHCWISGEDSGSPDGRVVIAWTIRKIYIGDALI